MHFGNFLTLSLLTIFDILLIKHNIQRDLIKSKKRITEIENKLNHRPRKSLGWKTPYEVFHEKEVA